MQVCFFTDDVAFSFESTTATWTLPHSIAPCTHKPPWSGTSSPEAVLQLQHPPVLCQSLHPMEMQKSPHLCRMSISTNLLNPDAVIYHVTEMMPSPESESQLRLLFHSCSLVSLFQRAPLCWLPPETDWFFGFDQHSVLMWAFFPQVPTNSVLVGSGTPTPTLDFYPPLPSPFPFLPFLPPVLPPLPKLPTSIGSAVFSQQPS